MVLLSVDVQLGLRFSTHDCISRAAAVVVVVVPIVYQPVTTLSLSVGQFFLDKLVSTTISPPAFSPSLVTVLISIVA